MLYVQASLSLPGSPYNLRRGSRGSQFSVTWARNNARRVGDRKPLVLQTFLDAQEHLPYADDSAAVTPMSEENGAIVIPVYTNLHSRHSSYTSHSSRISYTSHGDIYGRGIPWTKESQLLSRRNLQGFFQEVIHLSFIHLLSSFKKQKKDKEKCHLFPPFTQIAFPVFSIPTFSFNLTVKLFTILSSNHHHSPVFRIIFKPYFHITY